MENQRKRRVQSQQRLVVSLLVPAVLLFFGSMLFFFPRQPDKDNPVQATKHARETRRGGRSSGSVGTQSTPPMLPTEVRSESFTHQGDLASDTPESEESSRLELDAADVPELTLPALSQVPRSDAIQNSESGERVASSKVSAADSVSKNGTIKKEANRNPLAREVTKKRRAKKRPLKFDVLIPSIGSLDSPTVIMLHGAGGSPANWREWGAAAQARGFVAVAPQASNKPGIKRWGEGDIEQIVELVHYLIAKLAIDKKKVYLIGHSNGAFYATMTALRHPGEFAAVVSIGGGCNVFQFDPRAKEIGLCFIHGTKDRIVPIAASQSAVERLRSAGFHHVRMVPMQGRGHELILDYSVFEWFDQFPVQEPLDSSSPDPPKL